jgi:hypothetical protein
MTKTTPLGELIQDSYSTLMAKDSSRPMPDWTLKAATCSGRAQPYSRYPTCEKSPLGHLTPQLRHQKSPAMSTLSKESYYLRDWVLSLGSNVHIATDEAWFSTLINFDSHVGKKPHILPVKGVGVVELELESRGHGAGHKLVLEPVLYV